jgi:hypothetical protein
MNIGVSQKVMSFISITVWTTGILILAVFGWVCKEQMHTTLHMGMVLGHSIFLHKHFYHSVSLGKSWILPFNPVHLFKFILFMLFLFIRMINRIFISPFKNLGFNIIYFPFPLSYSFLFSLIESCKCNRMSEKNLLNMFKNMGIIKSYLMSYCFI